MVMETTKEGRSQRWFPVLLFAISALLLAKLVAPFAGAFFAAVVLAAALYPLQRRFSAKLGGRQHWAAATITLLVVLTVVLPLGFVGALAGRKISQFIDWAEWTVEWKGLDGLVEPLPEPLRAPARQVLAGTPDFVWDAVLGSSQADLLSTSPETQAAGEADSSSDREPGPQGESTTEEEDSAEARASTAPNLEGTAQQAQEILSRFFSFLVRAAMLVMALFFLLSEGKSLVAYLVELVPLRKERTRALLAELRMVTVAVLTSTLLTALAQTLVALAGYLIAGIPALPLVLFLTFLCSFIPAIGAGGVVLATGILRWMSGDMGMGIFLMIWGVAVVGLVDNVLKPLFARNGVDLPSSLVFFAMICGLAAFGAMGLVAGPLIVALFAVAARLVREVGLTQKSGPEAEPD